MFTNGIDLQKTLQQKSSNLQLAKFIAALLVIYSHSFSLTGNVSGVDFFSRISGNSLSTGGLAVSFFFFVSGLYVSKSLVRAKTAKRYFTSRVKRIFPALLIVVLASVLVLGPVFTNLTPGAYFTSKGTYLYLLNGALLPIHALPGVFTENPYGTTVNGSLWTLSVEFLCYVALFVVYKLNLMDKKKILAVLAVVAVASVGGWMLPDSLALLKGAILPGLLFFEGILFYLYQDKIKLNIPLACLFLLLFGLTAPLGCMDLGSLLFLPYASCTFLLATRQVLPRLSELGNLSYCIYLLGFPVQQCFVAVLGKEMGAYSNALLSSLVVILLSVGLYYLAEKPFSAPKKKS